jgi:hypothetical protein
MVSLFTALIEERVRECDAHGQAHVVGADAGGTLAQIKHVDSLGRFLFIDLDDGSEWQIEFVRRRTR